jgi:hypothetical protein
MAAKGKGELSSSAAGGGGRGDGGGGGRRSRHSSSSSSSSRSSVTNTSLTDYRHEGGGGRSERGRSYACLEDALADCTAPILGLDQVTELNVRPPARKETPLYDCDICQVTRQTIVVFQSKTFNGVHFNCRTLAVPGATRTASSTTWCGRATSFLFLTACTQGRDSAIFKKYS